MKTHILLRKIHHWGSIILAAPLLVMILAGLVLMLKKDIAWIQPPTQTSAQADRSIPATTLSSLLSVAQTVDGAGISDWSDIGKIDIRPDKGVAKLLSVTDMEVQIDLYSMEVLQVAYRRSDWIEALHDGSFFASWTKHWLFLPAGILLLVLWVTGLYLFFLPYMKRARKKKRGTSSGEG